MEKFNNHPLIVRLRGMFQSRESTKGMSVYLVWRLVLAIFFASAIAVTALAWISYDWALEETELQFSRPNREVFSIDELHRVIELYQQKERDHEALKTSPPAAPTFGAGN